MSTLGLDEQIWLQLDPRDRGMKELTGMVDLGRNELGEDSCQIDMGRHTQLRSIAGASRSGRP
ncbi:hypothetical protein [Citricoccus sp. NR2]|uniref:hypothetical protein n=1 Tax=Citricoccus sp. NR2 TaxID=3004095 RepID=UPI0022DDA72F|nr:hypothetical protein [Citricoccus sp. NR2]WBL19770.1 hypothetical protein O1A05_03485 [Citricoccus sp. NR2]